MALAVQCALALDQVLTGHGTAVGISHRLRHALARQVAPAWRQAHPAPRPAGGIRARYAARIAAAATTDPHAAALLLHPLHPAPPPALAALRPRVLRAALRTPPGPGPFAPPSTTHGPDTPRRRTPAPPMAPAVRSAGAVPARPADPPPPTPAPAPAGERRRP
ncbi:hypothetical protein [Streptomyces sp. NBC_00696]|nr:hypothetical protein [Streptomyces sp. NBC_00696]